MSKPNNGALRYAIDSIRKDIEKFEEELYNYPNHSDAQNEGYWKIAIKELGKVIVWLESEIF